MAEQNPLVEAEPDSQKWEDGLMVVDFAVDSARAVDNEDWCEAGITATAAGLDAVAVAADPFDALLTSAFAWMMEHVWPLPDMLDSLAGNHDQVQANAHTWANISDHLRGAATDMQQAVDADTAGWRGPAADGYRMFASGEAKLVEGAAEIAKLLGSAVSAAGTALLVVRTTVRDMIASAMSELVTYLVRSSAAAGLSLGAATPLIVADGIRIVAKWASKVSKWLDRIVGSFRKLAEIVGKAKPALAKVDDTLQPGSKLGQSVQEFASKSRAANLTLSEEVVRNTAAIGATHDDQDYAKHLRGEHDHDFTDGT
ncbi:WXG100 family type VII secretion target [Actinopolyspora mortivallis]|uniref:WXG100 family type VII secretion target n=1 Tax=Actinopolyspora mortivallis TaxID=33906 RepID=UPI0003A45A25|nr:WXG100 family type VII secretion target [Actinopolyspora mortivallis]